MTKAKTQLLVLSAVASLIFWVFGIARPISLYFSDVTIPWPLGNSLIQSALIFEAFYDLWLTPFGIIYYTYLFTLFNKATPVNISTPSEEDPLLKVNNTSLM